MNQNKLPADPLALILGVLALVVGIAGCCCYGVTAIIPLAMAIIGLVVANKSLREFGENPDAYDPQSRSNVSTAKIINIIAIVLNGLIFLVAISVLAFYGTLVSSALLDGFENGNFDDDYFNDIEIEIDTTNTWQEEDYIIDEEERIELEEIQEEAKDSLRIEKF